MRLSDKTYDILKMVQRWIPLIATLYVALAGIWKLPLSDEISKTLMAIAAFLAGILEIATATYNGDSLKDIEIAEALEEESDEEEGLG